MHSTKISQRRVRAIAVAAVAVAALLGSIAVQPVAGARADDSLGLPVIEGPQDQTVLDGEAATFTSTIDRSATIEWWGELAGQSEFSKMFELGTFNGKYTLVGSPSLDGLKIKAIYTIDGETVETEPATMRVLSADDPIEVTDEDTSIGGDAYFTVLDASAEPLASVQWQQAPAGDADQWSDLTEDADHEGVATARLHLSGDATAAEDGGTRFRAEFTTGLVWETQPKALDGNAVYTNIATLTVDDVRISAPKILETVPGEKASFPIAIDWPGHTSADLLVAWEYSGNPEGWTGTWKSIRPAWYGTSPLSNPNPLVIDAESYSSWDGYAIRAVVKLNTGGKEYYSPYTKWTRVAAIDQTLPSDASAKSGSSVEFTAASPAGNTTVSWQKQSPTPDSPWVPVSSTQLKDLKASLVLSKVVMADNGYRFRPAFAGAAGQPHYGRTATLTVTPAVEISGIHFDPERGGYRFYVAGIDQKLPNGMDTVQGKTYFVRDGAIMLGDIKNPAVPGGRAVFTLADGLVTSQMIRYGNALRYVDATGAMKLDAGEVTFNGNRYVFDSTGLGVQVIAEKLIGGATGGSLRVRLVEVDGFSTFVQFSAAQEGALGGLASDLITVTIGTQTARFALNQKAEVVAGQLSRVFANYAGQASVDSVSVTLTRPTGTEVFSDENNVTCPATETRGIPVQCTTFPVNQDSFEQHLQKIWTTAADAINNTTPAALHVTVGATLDTVLSNVDTWSNNDLTGITTAQMTALFEPYALLTADTERLVVRPQIEYMHAETVGAFQDVIRDALDRFNERDTLGLGAIADEVQPEFWAVPDELEGRRARAVRAAGNTAVARYIGPGFAAYQTNLNAVFLDRLNAVGPTDPTIIAAAALCLQAQTASDYEATLQAETGTTLDVYHEMLQILLNSPYENVDGQPITITYANLEALARQTLGLQ